MSEPHAEYVDRIINRLPPDLAAVFAEHITPEKMRELLMNAVGLVAERHIGEVFAEFQRLIVQEVPRTR